MSERNITKAIEAFDRKTTCIYILKTVRQTIDRKKC